jgi:hypothetical protein
MQRCSRGHFYDASTHRRCPSCGIPGLDVAPTREAAAAPGAPPPPVTAPFPLPRGAEPVTGSMDVPELPALAERTRVAGREERTRVHRDSRPVVAADPVVGWLVAIDGALRGRDYRIRAEGNSIGSEAGNRIVVDDGTGTIARQRHAVVFYDPRDAGGPFHIVPGDGPLTRVNERAVYQVTRLHAYDVVAIGATRLLFVPLCGERFEWALDDAVSDASGAAG